MAELINETFGINLKLLKLLRLYDSKQQTNLDLAITCIVYFSFMLHVPVFGTLRYLLEEDLGLEKISDNACLVAEMICYIAKFLPFVSNRKRIVKCINFLDEVRVNLNEKQQEMINKAVRTCKRNSNIFLIFISFGFAGWATKPIFSSEQDMPIEIWIPVNLTQHRVWFSCVYFYVALGIGYPCFASAAVDPLIAGLASLASAHLRVLKDNLECLEQYANIKVALGPNTDKSIIRFKIIQECVEHHNALLYFSKEFEQCFSQVVFSQFAGSIFVICLCCFQLTTLEAFSMDFLSTLDYLVAFLAQIYFYNFYGTELFEESKGLSDAIYMSKWYEYDLKSKKALLMVMERSKTPIVITAGKMFDLSLETFATILRRSYSLLAVLNNQQ